MPNSVIRGILGFLPPGAPASVNTTIAITDSEHRIVADNRRTQIDIRFAKILLGAVRAPPSRSLNNLLNTDYATEYEDTYSFTQASGSTWADPTEVYAPRFVRLNFTVNF